jgi:hypothetical protein
VADNTWVFSGRIEPIHSLIPLRTAADPTRSWFRLPKGPVSTTWSTVTGSSSRTRMFA